MSGATAQTTIPDRPGWFATIMNRQLDAYPDTGPRMVYLARWRPRDARRDQAEHEAMVQAELAKISASA